MKDPLMSIYASRWTLNLRGLRRAMNLGVISRDGGVDLSRVNFVTPGGMTGLSCLLERWAAELGPVTLVPPDDDISGYMARMDFFDLLDGLISPSRSLYYLRRRSRHQASLSELRKVDNPAGVTDVVARFSKILTEGSLQEVEVRHCCEVLSESLINVLDHAESSCGAYTAIQKWGKRGEVCVAVADAGLGIPYTIRHHPRAESADNDDHSLIEVATELGVSRSQEVGRGGGLNAALRSVGDGSGRLKIWAGQGWVEFSGVGSSNRAERVLAFGGTCVETVFPLKGIRV
jgi:anti-sigma regulatory factor (Ser/Thr protein kinase)